MRWVLSLVGIYTAVLLWMFFFQDHFLYFPSHKPSTPASAGAIDFTEVDYPVADGLRLKAWYRPPPTKTAPVMMIFHGNADVIANWGTRATAYAKLGMGVMLVEYRGFGPNQGKPSEKNFIADGQSAIAWLKDQDVSAQRIVLYGHSLGTGVAVALASVNPVRALLLESPFAAVVDVAAIRFPLLPVKWLMRDQFQSIERIKQVKAPITIVHGDQDIVIPISQAEKLASAAMAPITFHRMSGGGHVDLYEKGAFELFKRALVNME